MQGDRVNKWMLCYSDNVGKELKYNHYIFTSSTDTHAPRPKQQRCSEKNRHPKFGDTWETILMAPLQSVFCASTTQPKVTPTNHHFLIDIHHHRFSLGHQGLPRLQQSLEKLPASKKQEGVCGHGEVFPTVAWWAVHREPAVMGEASRDSVPLLAKLVKRVFPVPATSSKFEQVLSVAGNVVTPIRANLNPEKVKDLVVVKCNSRLLKSMGFIRK